MTHLGRRVSESTTESRSPSPSAAAAGSMASPSVKQAERSATEIKSDTTPNRLRNGSIGSSGEGNKNSSPSPISFITNINKLIMAQRLQQHQQRGQQPQRQVNPAAVAKSASGGITLAFPLLPSAIVSSQSSSASHSSLNSASTSAASSGYRRLSPQPNAQFGAQTSASSPTSYRRLSSLSTRTNAQPNVQPNASSPAAANFTAAGAGAVSQTSLTMAALASVSGAPTSAALAGMTSQQLYRPQQAGLNGTGGVAVATTSTTVNPGSGVNIGRAIANTIASSPAVNVNTCSSIANTIASNASINSNIGATLANVIANRQAIANNPATIANPIAANPLLALNRANGSVVNAYATAATAAALLPGGSVPEFLYQLTKMLTDPNNREIIEWSTHSGDGRIEVHHPARLEREVLGRYFRHSKYSSFQRQLNYFGFRKIAGKGKMSPCSYVNEAATTDIRSLLLMKRKNSKEKERELMQLRQLHGDKINSGMAELSKKRSHPGDDIQPATVRPMFTTSLGSSGNGGVLSNDLNAAPSSIATGVTSVVASNAALSNTAASPVTVSNAPVSNAAPVTSSGPAHQAQQATSPAHNQDASQAGSPASTVGAPVKRIKLLNQPVATTSDGRAYTVAVGKGVRHQLNGYLKSSNPSNGSAAGKTSASYASYLFHPSARVASSAPAPLKFLDPSELGMSVENSLNQLKDAFVAASGYADAAGVVAAGGRADAAGDVGAVEDAPSSPATRASATASATTGVPSRSSAPSLTPSTRRVSPVTTFAGGMLSRDDSLINLAMLPTLEGADYTGSATSEAAGAMSAIFSREDSLMNLAAAVELADAAAAADPSGNDENQEKESGDSFGFINFQS